MKSYTVHLRNSGAPVLVREGFSLWALVFGPVWLVQKQAFLAAFTLFLVWLALLSVHWGGQPVLCGTLLWCQGLFGLDWRRRNLMISGYDLSFVVAGRDEGAALTRLLDEYPGLRSRAAA